MSYQSLLQQVDDDQRWGGNGSGSGWSTRGSTHGSDRLKPSEGSSLVQEVDGGSSRSAGGGSGGGGGVYRGSFAAPLAMLSTGNRSGYGGDLTLFSPSDLFSSSPQQPLQQTSASSPFSWQSLLGGQPSARWQPDAALHGYSTFGGGQAGVEPASEVNVAYAQGERNVRLRGGGGQNEQCVAHEDDGVTSEVDADRSGEVKEKWTNNVNSEENWRKFGGVSLAFHYDSFCFCVMR